MPVEPGAVYSLPLWRVVDGTGIVKVADVQPGAKTELLLTFARGSKEEPPEIVERRDGVLIEQLLGLAAFDLQHKNRELPSPETQKAIEKVQEALFWLNERQHARKVRGVDGTYRK